MASQQSAQDNLLISALPPATDYMTYLTLLEYQLTPQNLPTLSRLLSDDDGKLAEEIGWDLLKLILPMLSDNPGEATRCLEIVARRGNPREVVVRVAEELEKLSDQTDNTDGAEWDDDQEELPTFPGEAPRVHLGQMTLDGMPDTTKLQEPPAQAGDQANTTQQSPIKSLQMQALLNMLSILHPRIRTQFPSRFLATSLPAALGAYRQIPITTATTSAFLSMLEKLAGIKRPALPPRTSTQGVAPAGSTSVAPLPDPEAKAEAEDTGVNVSSSAEKAIISRLVNAVLLEIMDEFFSSIMSQEQPSMSWTARLRERIEPKRVIPGRVLETKLWEQAPELLEREALVAKFGSISREMQLDTGSEIRKLIQDDEDDTFENPYHQDEPSEYPTSPSQIPFPRDGVIYLHAYNSSRDSGNTTNQLTTTELTKLIAHSFPLSATPEIPLPALQDALLSLLYKQALAVAPAPTTSAHLSPAKFVLLMSTLTQLFTITPHPSLRDSAHYISTKLLHLYSDPSVRLRIITQTLEGSTLSTNWAEIEDEEISTQPLPEPDIVEETGLTRSTSALVPHPIPLAPPQQLGQLKAIAVNWLKDEFITWITAQSQQGESNSAAGGLDLKAILAESPPAEGDDPTNDENSSLIDLIFPSDLPLLSPSAPTSSSSSSTTLAEVPTALPDFLLSIPFFISSLNLTCIIHPHLSADNPTLQARISTFIDNMVTSSRILVEILQHADKGGAVGGRVSQQEDEGGVLEHARADIFALEDACARARGVVGKSGGA